MPHPSGVQTLHLNILHLIVVDARGLPREELLLIMRASVHYAMFNLVRLWRRAL